MSKPTCVTDYENALKQSGDFIATIRHYVNDSLVEAEKTAMKPIVATNPDRKRIKYSVLAENDAERLTFARNIATRMGTYAQTEFPNCGTWDNENTLIAMNGLYGNGGAEAITHMVDAMVKAQGANFSFTSFYDTLSKPAISRDGQVIKPGLDYVHNSIMGDARRVLNDGNKVDIANWINEEMNFDAGHKVNPTKIPDLDTAVRLLGSLGKSKDIFAQYRD